MKALTAAEMREVDRLTIERYGTAGTQLMENAGAAVAEAIFRQISARGLAPVRQIVVLCGKGNNGGDGFVAARHLRHEIRRTTVILLGSPAELRDDNALNYQRWHQAGGETLVVADESAWSDAFVRLRSAEIVIDAMLGTGLRGAARGLTARAIEDLNRFSRNATAAVPALIVAVDIASGLPSDSGAAAGPAVHAHLTVTFTAPKIGQLISRDAGLGGDLLVRDIGSPVELVEEAGKSTLRWAGPEEFRNFPLVRPADSHKGLYGHAAIVAGSPGMAGAAVLAGMGALKAGAGLVTIATSDVVQPVVAAGQPEYMTGALPTKADGSIDAENFGEAELERIIHDRDVLAIGPGLGLQEGTKKFIWTLTQWAAVPVILDAAALSAFAGNGDELRKRKAQFLTITPHPGEMGRLLGVSTAEVQKDRVGVARETAKRWNAHVLLKGFHTVLAGPDGQIFINTTGNAGLAKGGSGDVLTGVLAGLTAQFGTGDWLRLIALGAWLHGRAAESLVEDADPSGMVASEVARALPYARQELLEEIRRGG
ncbi:MAG TPA: NAD(P)H-hydrate dehydratase [Candidatus Eisenbacteria bacterium]|nr:NAD(P)H-hydrate dehydratase [Candidatus Eisenbacteria bacterium]